jgi:acyl transferase domain-containing protein/SAM-dependent methyltransferase
MMGSGASVRNRNNHTREPAGGAEPVAIIGMRGRFPGANDLDQFWANLAEGVESISILTHEEIKAAGVPEQVSRLPGYVNASPVLDGVDQFDAQFFGFSARDATLTDPQHRLFLETAWEALEDAGYDPAQVSGPIGVFGGSELSTYLYHLYQNLDALKYIDGMQLMVTNDKDHLCTQVSYRLNLRGPSVVVQTTCSTSLVAVSLACESLQARRCDMALAGGVTVRVPQRAGYFYVPGSILSPDGHCRPFDANAQGTIVGSGVGIIVLKRLSDAVRDRDNVRAVILGTGLNNDGSDKVGYTAPSTRGQAAAIRAAHAMAGVSAESFGYVEAHGTGTILGDPIELSALTEVFRDGSERSGYCGIGSVKSNFGHLSCAAGIAGLIKTVLSMEHKAIVPTVHYTAPNPAIDLGSSPFYVATQLIPWERNGMPRRAGVSSFGVGGTNAHIVIEEAPARDVPTEKIAHQLLTLSARSEAALAEASKRLATHLEKHPEADLADAAYTLHLGRRPFKYRRAFPVKSDDTARAITLLRNPESFPAVQAVADRPVAFMFSGQGSQYPGMAGGLYKSEPLFRRSVDRCARILKPAIGFDLRRLIFPAPSRRKDAAGALRDTKWAQPALFTIGYALAQLWISWGVQPAGMIGHSVGEYVAAVLAGVMSLEDALGIIARRGQLISALPRGSMLAVMADAEAVERFLTDSVSIAAVNAPGFCVLSGPDADVANVEAALTAASLASRRLHTSHAFHSSMMDPILDEFESIVSRVELSAPDKRFVSTLTGNWAGAEMAKPSYWVTQVRQSVRFADAFKTLIGPGSPVQKDAAFVEAGPGNALTTFASETLRTMDRPALSLTSLPGPGGHRTDTEEILASLGALWSGGVVIDWQGFHRNEPRSRISLPTYPFERQSYWVGKRPENASEIPDVRDTSKWLYESKWIEAPLTGCDPGKLIGQRILLFDEAGTPGAAIAARIDAGGCIVIRATRGAQFECSGDREYVVGPSVKDDLARLAHHVCSSEPRLAGVVYCWGATAPESTDLDAAATFALYTPMRLACAFSSQQTIRPLPLLFVARGTVKIDDGDPLDPNRALVIGAARVIPQEYPGLRTAHIDIDDNPAAAEMLVAELAAGVPDPTVGLRNGRRYVESYLPIASNSTRTLEALPPQPVVLITGGLGHMGLHLAEAVFNRMQAKLVLVGRTNLGEPAQWVAKSEDASTSPEQRILFRRLAAMRAKRDEVIVLKADLNNPAEVRSAVDAAIAHFGQIDLLIHGAARIDAAAFAAVADTGPEQIEAQFSPKLRGLFHTIEAMHGRQPRRWVLHSSISAVLGGLALGAYAAANAVLDTLAISEGSHWLSIEWDAWDNAAEAQSASLPLAINPTEGGDVFIRILKLPLRSRVLVAVNLEERLKDWVQHSDSAATKNSGAERHPRPNLSTAYQEPRTDTERTLAEIWASQLGLESVGMHDRFFDLGGHSLLAAQLASEICDRFQIELPVLKLFQAPTVAELATVVDKAKEGGAAELEPSPSQQPSATAQPKLLGNAIDVAAKQAHRDFYDDVSRRLEQSGVGGASFFLNYGYVSLGDGDEARFEVPDRVFNRNSVRLAFELIADTELEAARVLDVGCGRGGTVALMAETFGADAVGVDLAPEAVAFCRKTHQNGARFEVGDAEHLPFDDAAFQVVTNIESSHTYPNLRAFYAEVRRVLETGGRFLYTDLLPVERWMEVRVLLPSLGLKFENERDITANVLASCDAIAATRAQAFGGHSEMIDNFLAVPGSGVYEQMRSGAWQYRIVRATRR